MELNISEQFTHTTETTHEMWTSLKRQYGKQDNFTHIFQIKQEIAQNKQGQKTICSTTNIDAKENGTN
jgi:hypothetical protein